MATVGISDLKKFISKILKGADLTKLSSKMIRKRCEEQFDTDLTSRKQEIDHIVMSFISKGSSDHNDSNSDDDSDNKSGTSSDNESSAKSDSEEKSSDDESGKPESPPKAKKQRSENSSLNDRAVKPAVNNSSRKNSKPVGKKKHAKDLGEPACDSDDAALARQLQEEEWNLRSRSSRRGGTKNKDVKQKKDENKERKSRKGTSTYTRKCLLSPELAEIMESQEMARPDVVKKMWSIVRERDLFDPSNKQFALCDEQLRKVFGAKRIRMFSMMKYLKNHIKDLN